MQRAQHFLQIVMHRGILDEANMLDVCQRTYDDREVERHIDQTNKRLEDLGMAIQRVTCEQTGETYYVFTGTNVTGFDNCEDDTAEYSRAQRELLGNIFSEIITSDYGYLSSNNCINMVGEMKEKLSRSGADKFIHEMAARKWLHLNQGRIYMGVRSVAEFMPLFKSKFRNSLSSCALCKKIVFHGKLCNNCPAKFHQHCLSNYAKMLNNEVKCCECKQLIEDNDESLVNEDSESVDGGLMEDIDEDDSDEDEPSPSTYKAPTRRSRRSS